MTLLLHKEFPDLKFVVQDLEKQIAAGEAVCRALSRFYSVYRLPVVEGTGAGSYCYGTGSAARSVPDFSGILITSSSRRNIVHDFFTPQPVKNASIYFLRVVLHDWSDIKALEIMKRLREAAGPSSKLLVFDSLAVHTCDDPQSTANLGPKPPKQLLTNLGIAGQGFFTALDLQV